MGWDIDEKQLSKMPGVRNVSDSREGCQVSPKSSPGKHGGSPDKGTRMKMPQGKGKGGPKPQPREPRQRKNQTEQRYEREYLQTRLNYGDVVDWVFEGVKLRLADNTFYTPDFFVVKNDCFEIVEVKGSYEREDARVKWKCAAEQYPWFRFFVARWMGKKKGWKIEEYG